MVFFDRKVGGWGEAGADDQDVVVCDGDAVVGVVS